MRNIKRQPRMHKRACTHADMTMDRAIAHVRDEARGDVIHVTQEKEEMSGCTSSGLPASVAEIEASRLHVIHHGVSQQLPKLAGCTAPGGQEPV